MQNSENKEKCLIFDIQNFCYLCRENTTTCISLVLNRHEPIKPLSSQIISTTEVVLKSYLSVRPYAKSSMSFSSSVIASNFSYICFSKMRWQVEQAKVPSHAPTKTTDTEHTPFYVKHNSKQVWINLIISEFRISISIYK